MHFNYNGIGQDSSGRFYYDPKIDVLTRVRDNVIEQMVFERAQLVSRQLIDLKDVEIRRVLTGLGWTPPPDAEVPRSAFQATLSDTGY